MKQALGVHCPNCGAGAAAGAGAASADPCPACGYSGRNAREYFWLYGGGAAVILLGFVLGVAGVLLQGAPPDHGARRLGGWYPIPGWPEEWHWLSFLVAGIFYTLAGMGITRRRWSGWAAFTGLAAVGAAGAILALAGAREAEGAAGAAAMLLAAHAVLLALGARLWLSFRRTPPRDPSRIREAALRAAPGQRA